MPEPQTVLVVDDENSIAETIVYALRTEGFDPVWTSTGREALNFMASRAVALVILDLGLPDMSGFDVCREIRRQWTVPIIFLTARAGEIDRVVGLELGGDDYVAKPFSPRELTARVRAILRRSSAPAAGTPATSPPRDDRAAPALTAGTWRVDESRCRITYRGVDLTLTPNEYRLLRALVLAPGRVFSREQLMTVAWPDPGSAMDRTVDAHVKSVRAKLREVVADGDPIVTHRGLGYALREE